MQSTKQVRSMSLTVSISGTSIIRNGYHQIPIERKYFSVVYYMASPGQ